MYDEEGAEVVVDANGNFVDAEVVADLLAGENDHQEWNEEQRDYCGNEEYWANYEKDDWEYCSEEEGGWEEPWAEDVSQVDIVDMAGSDDDGSLCEGDKRGLASFLPANYGNVARGSYDLLGSVNRRKQSGDRAPLTTVPQKGRGRDGRDRDHIPPFGGSLTYNSFQNGFSRGGRLGQVDAGIVMFFGRIHVWLGKPLRGCMK